MYSDYFDNRNIAKRVIYVSLAELIALSIFLPWLKFTPLAFLPFNYNYDVSIRIVGMVSALLIFSSAFGAFYQNSVLGAISTVMSGLGLILFVPIAIYNSTSYGFYVALLLYLTFLTCHFSVFKKYKAISNYIVPRKIRNFTITSSIITILIIAIFTLFIIKISNADLRYLHSINYIKINDGSLVAKISIGILLLVSINAAILSIFGKRRHVFYGGIALFLSAFLALGIGSIFKPLSSVVYVGYALAIMSSVMIGASKMAPFPPKAHLPPRFEF